MQQSHAVVDEICPDLGYQFVAADTGAWALDETTWAAPADGDETRLRSAGEPPCVPGGMFGVVIERDAAPCLWEGGGGNRY